MEVALILGEQDLIGLAADAGEAEAGNERCGYGACSQCTCTAYLGSGDLCGNCHHNYSFHW